MLLALLLLVSLQDTSVFETGGTRVLAGEGSAGEGPAWHPVLGVLTSGHGGIWRLTSQGTSVIYRANAGTNGLLFDTDGSLLACEPVLRRVTRTRADGSPVVLTDSFEGHKYNQPNDITVDKQGRIYFSDPRYGPRDGMEQRDNQGRTVEGVYRIDRDGKVARIIGREVERANGVLVSQSGKYLFVADNNNDTAGGARKLWRFNRGEDGSINLATKTLLYDWGTGRGPDGLKQDSLGRLFVAAGLNKPNPPHESDPTVKAGIYVIHPETGAKIDFLPIPTDEVTNCAFGGKDRKTLYVTGGGTLYAARVKVPGVVVWPTE